jgi:hypothetical protein
VLPGRAGKDGLDQINCKSSNGVTVVDSRRLRDYIKPCVTSVRLLYTGKVVYINRDVSREIYCWKLLIVPIQISENDDHSLPSEV